MIIVKLKRHLRYRGNVNFESVRPEPIYAHLNYLKNKNKFYEDISISYGLSSNGISSVADASFAHEQTSINHPYTKTENKLNFELFDDPLNLYRVAPNETALISEIQGIIDEDNLTVAPGQGKSQFAWWLLWGKIGYKVKREVSLSPVKHFNQRLLNFKQTFASDAGFILFARSIVEQHHLNFSINISMQKVRVMQITAGTVKQNYKESVKKLNSPENAYYFLIYVKDRSAYWKQFLFEVSTMVK